MWLKHLDPYFEQRMAELDKIRSMLPYREARVLYYPGWQHIAGWAKCYPAALVHNFERRLDRMMNLCFSWEEETIVLFSTENASYGFLDTMSYLTFEDMEACKHGCMFGYFGDTTDENIREEILLQWQNFLQDYLAQQDIEEEQPDAYENYQLRLRQPSNDFNDFFAGTEVAGII